MVRFSGKCAAGLSGYLVALSLAGSVAHAQEAKSLVKGQPLFLPIYSHMLYGNISRSGKPNRILLSAMVSIRNTDGKRPLRILSARYYETQGQFLREYLPKPIVLAPFGTHELFVELHDDSGGSGANFLIRWEGETGVSPPVVEALHANLDSGKAVIFTTRALPVQTE